MNAAATDKWTEQNLKKLLETMKRSIANRHMNKTWSAGLKALDWEIVAFRPFSAEECSAKWDQIMQKLRKIKTLTELIVDAQSGMDSSMEDTLVKLPKKPLSANAFYFAENKDKLKKTHRGLSSRDMMKLANEKYHKLSAQNKEKYVLQSERAKEKYQLSMKTLKRLHSSELKKQKKKSVNENARKNVVGNTQSAKKKAKASTIPLNGYNLFCREQKSSMAGIPQREIPVVWSIRWKRLSKEEKEEYSRRCREMKNPQTTQSKVKQTFPGEPSFPSSSISALYTKDRLPQIKGGMTSQERLAKVSRQSKSMSDRERKHYQAQIHDNFRIYKEQLQNWFKALSPEKQLEYCERNPGKLKYLQRKVPASSHRTSDSEDEDFDDSSDRDEDLYAIEMGNEDEDEDMSEENDKNLIFCSFDLF